MENNNFVGFYKENIEEKKDKEVYIVGFPEPFVIRVIKADEYKNAQEECMIHEDVDGRKVKTLDVKKLESLLVNTSLVHPNLNNKDLQDNWGAYDSESLKGKMFSAGQIQQLQLEILRYSDLDEDFNKKVQEAKKN